MRAVLPVSPPAASMPPIERKRSATLAALAGPSGSETSTSHVAPYRAGSDVRWWRLLSSVGAAVAVATAIVTPSNAEVRGSQRDELVRVIERPTDGATGSGAATARRAGAAARSPRAARAVASSGIARTKRAVARRPRPSIEALHDGPADATARRATTPIGPRGRRKADSAAAVPSATAAVTSQRGTTDSTRARLVMPRARRAGPSGSSRRAWRTNIWPSRTAIAAASTPAATVAARPS